MSAEVDVPSMMAHAEEVCMVVTMETRCTTTTKEEQQSTMATKEKGIKVQFPQATTKDKEEGNKATTVIEDVYILQAAMEEAKVSQTTITET